MQAGGDIADIGQVDQSAYSYLASYEALKGGNARRVYREI
jgi:hypothetical protein